MKSISIVWSTEDVQEMRPDLNDEQAYKVLLHVEHSHDANYGVCWETLDAAADVLYPDTQNDYVDEEE